MNILANARVVGSLSKPFHIDSGLLLAREGKGSIILGSDLQKRNGGIFDAFGLAIFGRTFTLAESEKLALLALQPDNVADRYFARFNGDQWEIKDLAAKDRSLHLSDESIQVKTSAR
jgi:hypothetical protein